MSDDKGNEHAKGRGGEKRNQLTHPQFFRLCEMMRNHEEWFKTNRPTWEEAAKYLAEACGFTVTKGNVILAKETTKVQWESRASFNSRGMGIKAQLAEAEKLIVRLLEDNQKLHASVDILRGLVHELYWQLGGSPPAGYTLPPDPNRMRNSPVINRK